MRMWALPSPVGPVAFALSSRRAAFTYRAVVTGSGAGMWDVGSKGGERQWSGRGLSVFASAVGWGDSAGAVVPGTGFILRKVSAARTALRPVPRLGLDRACEAVLTLPRLSAAVAACAALRSAVLAR